jgi:hypothetical protein
VVFTPRPQSRCEIKARSRDAQAAVDGDLLINYITYKERTIKARSIKLEIYANNWVKLCFQVVNSLYKFGPILNATQGATHGVETESPCPCIYYVNSSEKRRGNAERPGAETSRDAQSAMENTRTIHVEESYKFNKIQIYMC